MSFYDHYAKRERNKYGEKIKIKFAEKLFNLAIPTTGNQIGVLEIGPGDGYIASLTKKHNFSYTGIEGSQEVFTSLKNKGYNIINAMVPPLPADIGNYDLCFALQ